MLTQISTTTTLVKSHSFYDGEFDAAIGLPPKTHSGDYWSGYLAYTLKTGNTPF